MTFADAASRMHDAIFDREGEDALWKAAGAGEGVPVKVLADMPDTVAGIGDESVVLRTTVFRVRKSEIAVPAVGDVVTVFDTDFTVDAEPRLDKYRQVWLCEAEPA